MRMRFSETENISYPPAYFAKCHQLKLSAKEAAERYLERYQKRHPDRVITDEQRAVTLKHAKTKMRNVEH